MAKIPDTIEGVIEEIAAAHICRRALEMILELSDLEMADGDGARLVARAALDSCKATARTNPEQPLT